MNIFKLLLVSALAVLPISSFAADGAHWAYTGDHGPDHWGDLKSDFKICKTGKNQSPIDIKVSSAVEANLSNLNVSYKDSGLNVLNNGHTIQANYKEGSHIIADGQRFDLKQFHFHTPSENHIAGKSYPLEVHLVHADVSGNLAVIGVMFEEGAANDFLAGIWDHMPTKAGGTHEDSAALINANKLLPKDSGYYRFSGSLTTPPCSEGVRWFVMKKPLTASKAQVEAFHKVLGGNNNRPVQPTYARLILQ